MIDAQKEINISNLFTVTYDPLKEALSFLINNIGLNSLALKSIDGRLQQQEENIKQLNAKMETKADNAALSEYITTIINSKNAASTDSIQMPSLVDYVRSNDFLTANEKNTKKVQDLEIEIKKLKIGMIQLKKAPPKIAIEKVSSPPLKVVEESVAETNEVSNEKIELLKLEMKNLYATQDQVISFREKIQNIQKSIDDIAADQVESNLKLSSEENSKCNSRMTIATEEENKAASRPMQTKVQKIVMHSKDDKNIKLLTKKVQDIEYKILQNEQKFIKSMDDLEKCKTLLPIIDKKADSLEVKMQRSEISRIIK